MSTDKLLQELKDEVARLEDHATAAERRLEIAKNEAANLENRNQRAVELIEREVADHKQAIIAEAESAAVDLRNEAKTLQKTKGKLQDEIVSLQKTKQTLDSTVENLATQETILKTNCQQLQTEVESLTAEIAEHQQAIDAQISKADELKQQINQLQNFRRETNDDIEILTTEAESLQNKIMDLDATFKARKETFEKQLSDTQYHLRIATTSLTEAQNKDKAIRTAWAEKEMALEKRTQVVRRMEAKISNAESRLEELQRYDTL